MRLALFGGSFDPPHLGHLHVARAAHDELRLDRVLLLPASQPPHKLARTLAPEVHRVAMLELLARGLDWLGVDRRELERGGTSFTYDTVASFRTERAARADELYFLLGSDSLVDLPTWHRADELVRLVTIVTIPRDRESVELGAAQVRAWRPDAADHLLAHVLRVEPLPISSSQIRSRVRAGLPIDELTPRPIADYIAQHRIYGSP